MCISFGLQELCQVQKDNKMNPLLHATMYLSQKVSMCLYVVYRRELGRVAAVYNLMLSEELKMSWGSLVSIVSDLWTGWPVFNPWQGQRVSLVASASRLDLEFTQPSTQTQICWFVCIWRVLPHLHFVWLGYRKFLK